MDRRRAIGLVLFAWPFAALAQRTIPFVGFLSSGAPNERAHLVDAFRQGLKEGGYIDGKDVAIEYRWAEGRYERLPALAKDLVGRNVAVLVATGGNAPVLAAKSATTVIPIVFTIGGDPVKLGLVKSLSRPDGNVTGATNISIALNAKRLQILHELLPGIGEIACLMNPKAPGAEAASADIQGAAEATTTRIRFLYASNDQEIENAFSSLTKRSASALIVATDALFTTRRSEIVAFAAGRSLPAVYPFREFVAEGGLMSYGPRISDGYRQAGLYAARILKGAKAADLPVVQLSRSELVFNATTAKTLGLSVSRDFLARVDEVIQ